MKLSRENRMRERERERERERNKDSKFEGFVSRGRC